MKMLGQPIGRNKNGILVFSRMVFQVEAFYFNGRDRSGKPRFKTCRIHVSPNDAIRFKDRPR